jgi:hypothetical protein
MDDLNLLEIAGVAAIFFITIWIATKWEIAGKCLLTTIAAMWLAGSIAGVVGLILFLAKVI